MNRIAPMRAVGWVALALSLVAGLRWLTTASAANAPMLVRDINDGGDGSFPTSFAILGDKLLFSASDGTTYDTELYSSDGTSGGTFRILDINASGDSEPTGMTVLVNQALFTANDGATGFELWVTDGTSENTERLLDIVSGAQPDEYSPQPHSFTTVEDTTFFVAQADLTIGSLAGELWQTDGSAANTALVSDINSDAGDDVGGLTAYCGQLVFHADNGTAGRELWLTDGATTTMLEVNTTGAANPAAFTVFKTDLYFVADDGVNGRELWKTDGTTTAMVMDIMTGADGSNPMHLAATRDALFFVADDGETGRELWKTDGATTTLVAELNAGVGGADFGELVAGVDRVWFSADPSSNDTTLDDNLYSSDGTTISQLTSAEPSYLQVIGDSLYFQADDGINGAEPWLATTSGTQMIADLNPGADDSDPQGFLLHPTLDKIFFRATDATNGRELWAIDSTLEPTTADQCTLVPTAVETAQQTVQSNTLTIWLIAVITIGSLFTAYCLLERGVPNDN